MHSVVVIQWRLRVWRIEWMMNEIWFDFSPSLLKHWLYVVIIIQLNELMKSMNDNDDWSIRSPFYLHLMELIIISLTLAKCNWRVMIDDWIWIRHYITPEDGIQLCKEAFYEVIELNSWIDNDWDADSLDRFIQCRNDNCH